MASPSAGAGGSVLIVRLCAGEAGRETTGCGAGAAVGCVGSREVDLGAEVRVVVDELASDTGGAGDGGDGEDVALVDGGLDGGQHQSVLALPVERASLAHGLAPISRHWPLSWSRM